MKKVITINRNLILVAALLIITNLLAWTTANERFFRKNDIPSGIKSINLQSEQSK